jgi:linalool 8-monooxygenase
MGGINIRYPVRGINLKDPHLFERGVPHDLFAMLRRDAPVYWNPEPEEREPGFWALTKYDDVVAVSKNPELFSSALGGHQISYAEGMEFNRATAAVLGNMIAMDPPEHQTYRRLVSGSFSAGAARRLEPKIRAIVVETIDAIAPRGECEFVAEFAAEIPLLVLCELLGIPRSDRRLLFQWTNRLTEWDQGPAVLVPTLMEFFAYGQALYDERRKRPRDDLISVMAHATIDGRPVDQQLLDGFFILMVIAGNETTRNTISSGVLALAEHPEQRQLLTDEPSLIPAAVEEMLRWSSPVLHFRRTAAADTEIRGQRIARGDKVVMWYPSANRDADVFPRAGQFDVRRAPNPHLAFGEGEHFCLGSHLARLELRITFDELLRRIPDIRPADEVRWMKSYFLAGPTHMPVEFTAEKQFASRAAG